MCAAASVSVLASPITPRSKPYDYLLKFLLVGDSDVGKEEILSGLDDGSADSPYGFSGGKYDTMSMNLNLDIQRQNKKIDLYSVP